MIEGTYCQSGLHVKWFDKMLVKGIAKDFPFIACDDVITVA